MLRFFRNIRKKLTEHLPAGQPGSKVRTYILYSIGEILLVVVGILIALQVNNWNELKLAEAEERVLLENLKTDFETRYDELKEFRDYRNEIFVIIDELSNMVADPETIPPASDMHLRFSYLNNHVMFNEQFKVLDVLFNTGKIDKISNKELKTRLLQWPQYVEEMMEEQRMRYDIYNSVLLPLQYDYLNLRDIFAQFNFRGYSVQRDLPRTKTSDYEGLLTNPHFENYLTQIEMLHRVNAQDYETLIENAERIIKLIDIEMGAL